MVILISTDEVIEARRLSYWNDLVRLNGPSVEVTPLLDEPFFGTISTDEIAFIKYVEITTRPALVTHSQHLTQKAGEDHFEVIFQLTGETIIHQEDKTAHLRCGDWVFLDPWQLHALEHTSNYHEHTILLLEMPRRAFCTRLPNPELMSGHTISGESGLGRVTYDFILSLRRDIAQIAPETRPQIAEILLELLVTNLRETVCPALAAARNQEVMSLAARSFIHQRLADPDLSVAMIARALNISRSHLYLLFQREHTTVNRYIWNLRLEKCRADLMNPLHSHRTITEIACAYGFGNMTHFSRLFKQRYGLSARAYRQS